MEFERLERIFVLDLETAGPAGVLREYVQLAFFKRSLEVEDILKQLRRDTRGAYAWAYDSMQE